MSIRRTSKCRLFFVGTFKRVSLGIILPLTGFQYEGLREFDCFPAV